MLSKKRILMLVILLGLISLTAIFANSPIYLANLFFSLPLTDPSAPINELLWMEYSLSYDVIRTPVAIDAKGHFYIVGRKNGKVKIMVLNSQGKIERVITPCLKNGHFLRECFHISISPSGEYIWTFVYGDPWVTVLTAHDYSGKAKASWMMYGLAAINYRRVFAYNENSAYLVRGDGGVFCLRFVIGQHDPQEFEIPGCLTPVFFHDGKFWQIISIDELAKQFSKLEFKEQSEQNKNKKQEIYFGLISWTPEEGVRLVKKFPVQSQMIMIIDQSIWLIGYIKWIDECGNFYIFRPLPIYHPLSFLFEIDLIRHFFQAIGISDIRDKRVEGIQVFSPEGLLDKIILPSVIRPQRGEKLEYGQLIKADKTGIYLEVEKVNEPREYRIVRIVKKKRWQVWWEKLTSWWTKH